MRSKVAPWVVALLATALPREPTEAQRTALPPVDTSLFAGTPEQAASRWADGTRAVVARERRARWLFTGDGVEEEGGRRAARLPGGGMGGLSRSRSERRPPSSSTLPQDTSGLGIAFRGRFELKFDRLENQRCTAGDIGNPVSGCEPGFPTPFVDQQFSLKASGVVSQRIHLGLDYDSEREFSANNDIRVWYQGQEGEALQRVDVGNVTLDVPGSRFITAAIPANSFGVQAAAQFGALEVRSILAQQRGSSLRTRVYTVGERVTQPVDFELRDLDFEPGRFFFVVNPPDLPGYPDLDVLNLAGVALSPLLRPVSVRVYRLRAVGGAAGANPNLGGINAVALRNDSPQRVGPLPWELLVEGRDYYLDPSALWLALAARVGTEDFLAVSYVTASGATVGTFPAVGGGADTLELIYEPRRGPEVPTFAYEMRNAYRLGGPDITRSSLRLVVSLNHSERPLGGGDTYLGTLGLSLAGDPAGLDEYNRVFPRERDPNGGAPVRDLFVVFPHLTPFADSARLAARETNDSLYRTPAYLLQSQGPAPRFRLRVQYEATGPGDRSGLNLGAIQVREGSERLFVGDRQLIRGQDYQVFYDVGQVSFLNPDRLFTAPVVQVRAQFEENQLFDVAPKTIVGLSSTYRLGPHGRVDALGLFQQEQSVFTRPQLGFEPQAHFIGGVSTELVFQPAGITRALDALPLIQTTAPSFFTVGGELAVSRPNANQAGQAYVEEFEGTAGSRLVSLSEQSFQLGSRPASGRGLSAGYLASDGSFDARDAAALVWQNGVQVGNQPVEFEPRDIDSGLVLTGTARQIERVLWLSLKPDTVGGAPDPTTGTPRWLRPHTPGPRWRSITQALDRSGLGVDLSTVEYLEFWVLEEDRRSAAARGATLLLDFGTVFEDAVAPAPDSLRLLGGDTVFTGLQFAGAGRLDTEKDTLANVFNAAAHDIGILGDLPDSVLDAGSGAAARRVPLCRGTLATGLPIFPLGDLAARCTRGNGLLDTEDLNGDNRLDVTVGGLTEDLVRYVFPLGNARYFVRDGGATTDAIGRRFTWRLYRIPFRQDSLSIGNPDLRHIRALRLTVVTPDQGPPEDELFFALGRMRLVGAPWLKRAATPLAGLGGQLAQPHGEVVASVVSTDNQDLGYAPPPGVLNQAERRGVAFLFTSQQINEHALRLLARDLRPGERAEAFTRFAAEGDRNFLKYRQLRVWAQGRGGGWDQGDLEFFVKVGTDEDNFYLYRTRLVSGTWEPEILIDLQRWIALRGQIEARWLGGEPPGGAASCGGDSTALVACDGPYLVQVRDPGIAPPNLARVSEVAAGIYRVSANTIVDQAEVWVDDIRLGDVVNRAGLATALDLHLTAADLADVTLGLTRRDDRFRQLADDPSYVTDLTARVGSTLRLDKFLPAAWGMMLPLSVAHERTTADPFYLRQSDIQATALSDLRRPRSSVTTVQLDLRRPTRGGGLLPALLLDPLSVTGFLQNGDARAELWSTATRNRRLRAEYRNVPAARGVRIVPAFLVGLLDGLPVWLRESEFGRALRNARLRLNPAQVRLGSTLVDDDTRRFTFRVPVALASDSLVRAHPSLRHRWTNLAGLELRPFETLSLRADLTSTRDLQDYADTTAVARSLGTQRSTLFGWGAGFERQRSLSTAATMAPVVSSWLKPRFAWATGFTLIRDPNQRVPVVVGEDSVAPLASANFRRRQIGAALDLARLVGETGGGTLGGALRALLPADVSLTRERRSTFDRLAAGPDLRYQLGLGEVGEFRERDGVLATTAMETRTLTGSAGARLPVGLTVRGTYRDTDGTTWVLQGDGQARLAQHTREWPSGSLAWSARPGGALGRAVSSLNAQAQYRVSETRVRQGVAGDGRVVPAAGAVTESRVRLFTPSLTIAWRPGITTGAQYGQSRTDLTATGSTTRNDRVDWGGNLSFAFRAPRSLARLPNPIRTVLSGSASDTRACLMRAGTSACTPVADSRRSQFDARMDTGVSATVVGGASFSYILTDQRHLSSRFTQYVFTVFAEINFVTGRAP